MTPATLLNNIQKKENRAATAHVRLRASTRTEINMILAQQPELKSFDGVIQALLLRYKLLEAGGKVLAELRASTAPRPKSLLEVARERATEEEPK